MAKSIPEIKIGNEVYQIKDRTAREHLVEVTQTQPTSEDNKLWINDQEAEYEVPTMDEFNDLKSKISDSQGNIIPSAELKSMIDQTKKVSIIAVNDTASSAIKTFPDGADNFPMSVAAEINPVQDLHGYENPWPAGGGKNLLNATGTNENCTKDSDGVYTLTTVPSANISFKIGDFNVKGGKSYILSGGGGSNNFRLVITYNGTTYRSDSGESAPINVTEDATLSVSAVVTTNATQGMKIYPMVRESTQPTGFAPYSNICPISGWTGAEIWDDPAYGGTVAWNQLFDFTENSTRWMENGSTTRTWENGVLTISNGSSNAAYSYQEINEINGHVYLYYAKGKTTLGEGETEKGTLTINAPGVTTTNIRKIFDTTDTVVSGVWKASSTLTNRMQLHPNKTANTLTVYCCEFFDLTQLFGSTIADYIYSLEQATAGAGVAWFRNLFPKDYYPYNIGETTTVSAVNGDPYRHIEITFPSSAGTVYGGTLTVNKDGTGTLVVDKGRIYADGSFQVNSVSLHSSGLYYTIITRNLGAPTNNPLPISDKFNSYQAVSIGNCYITANGSALIAVLPDQTITTRDSATQWFAENPTEFIYKLATPVTYNLTDLEVIETLKGINNVWADTGNVSVNYPADTKLYIDKKFTELQALVLENISNT